MKRVNRFVAIFMAFAAILSYCVFFSCNPYINAILIYGSVMASIVATAHVHETIRDNEQKLLDKISNMVFGEE